MNATDIGIQRRRPGPAAVLTLGWALLAYLVFFAVFGIYWLAFLADLAVPVTVNHRPGGPPPPALAVAVDLALIALFGLQHSVMARPAFKRRWTRIVPPAAERATYVMAASLVLGLVMALWQPIPAVVWEVTSGPARAVLWSLFGLGMPLTVLASFQIDHFDLLGLRQAWARFRGRPYEPPRFVEPWLYRVVRHPIQLGALLLLWPHPTMTAGHLLLASGMTLYILVGLWFEERDLVAALGERYRAYRRRVPALLPLPAARRLPPPVRATVGRVALLALAVLALTAALALAAGCARPAGADGEGIPRGSVAHGGLERSYAVHRPANLAQRPALLLVLHGSGGDTERIRELTGHRFERLADEHGFVVAYPEGFEGNWNGCRAQAPFSANRRDVDDVGFLRRLAAELRAGAPDGPGSGGVYAFGFSGGGHLALRLALEAPDLLAGAAVIAASPPAPEASDCAPPSRLAVPLLLVAGDADPINPYGGGDVALPEALGGLSLGPVLGAEEGAARLAALAGHRGPPRHRAGPEVDGDPATGVAWREWRAPGLPPVALVTVVGGGHTIPQPGTSFPPVAGRHSGEIDAPAAAWRFFGGGRGSNRSGVVAR